MQSVGAQNCLCGQKQFCKFAGLFTMCDILTDALMQLGTRSGAAAQRPGGYCCRSEARQFPLLPDGSTARSFLSTPVAPTSARRSNGSCCCSTAGGSRCCSTAQCLPLHPGGSCCCLVDGRSLYCSCSVTRHPPGDQVPCISLLLSIPPQGSMQLTAGGRFSV